MIIILFIIAAYMWYKNRKNESNQNVVNEPMRHLSPSPPQPTQQLTNGLQLTNGIQLTQGTQQV